MTPPGPSLVVDLIEMAYNRCETPSDLLNLTASSPCVALSLFMTAYGTIMHADHISEAEKLRTIEALRGRMRETLTVLFQVVNSANPDVVIDALEPEVLVRRESEPQRRRR
jgi:hypothetical protein